MTLFLISFKLTKEQLGKHTSPNRFDMTLTWDPIFPFVSPFRLCQTGVLNMTILVERFVERWHKDRYVFIKRKKSFISSVS
jgi:hypothetical protein